MNYDVIPYDLHFSEGLSYQSSLLTLVKCIMSVDIDEDMEEFVGEVGREC